MHGVIRKVATYAQNNTNTYKSTQSPISRVGFQPTIPVFERAKTVHALDREVTAIGDYVLYSF
jgi:hypothetical protein